MADEVRRVEYCYLTIKDKPGEGEKILGTLREVGVNLLAFSGFPAKGGKAQIDLVTENVSGLKTLARNQKWKLSPVKRGFLIQGEDKLGAVAEIVAKLAAAKINIVAVDAVAAGAGRYGAILWVKPASYAKAAKALGAT